MTVAAEVAVIPWSVQRGEADVSSGVYMCKCWLGDTLLETCAHPSSHAKKVRPVGGKHTCC